MIRKKYLLPLALALSASAAFAEPADDKAPPPPPGKDGGQGPRQGEHRPVPPLVAALDTDSDGTISAAEIDKAPESLKKLDKNGDGKLTMDELRPQRPEGDGPRGPGDKGPAGNNQRGPGADGQGNKGGSRDGGGERKGPRDGQGRKGPGPDGGPAGKPGDAPEGAGKGGPQGGDRPGGGKRPAPPLISVLDADGDGVISADEIAGAAVSLRKLDKNGDGQLTPDEYRPEPPKRDGEQGNRPKGPRDGNGPKPPPKDGDNNAGDEAKKRPAAE